MKINKFANNIIYIEDAFPKSQEFINAIEENNNNERINNIIPPWNKWLDGEPVDGVWTPKHDRGHLKDIDWDYSINVNNTKWPRTYVDENYSDAHKEAYEILKLIDIPYKKSLDVWSQETGNENLNLVTKNYTIKKYNMHQSIPQHTDRDHDHHINTFDWTALIYLNDDYDGGEVYFNSIDLEIKPSAGSIIFFSSDEPHTAKTVYGNKYFIFCYIQSKYGFSHSINEKFIDIVKNIKKDRNIE